jgi:hypothetical protein
MQPQSCPHFTTAEEASPSATISSAHVKLKQTNLLVKLALSLSAGG